MRPLKGNFLHLGEKKTWISKTMKFVLCMFPFICMVEAKGVSIQLLNSVELSLNF